MNALKVAGYSAIKWDGKSQDVLKSFAPTLYIGATGWKQNIPSQRDFKVALHVNPWCGEIIKCDGPTINESTQNVEWALNMKPEAVFGYGLNDDMNKYWVKWRSHVTTVPMPTAGDTVEFYRDPSAAHKCELGFVGGRWNYKAKIMDAYLLPCLKRFKSKVYGWGGWQSQPFYMGSAADADARKLLSSAQVCPSISEPHTIRYGIDIPERIFKIPLCGTVTFTDAVAGIHRYFPIDMMPVAKNPAEYMRICMELISDSSRRLQLAIKQRAHVLGHHTYFHRVETLLRALGFIMEAENVKSCIPKGD